MRTGWREDTNVWGGWGIRPSRGPGAGLGGETTRWGPESLASRSPWGCGALGQAEQPGVARFAATYRALRALPRRVRRALRRKLALSLAEAALLLALGQGPAWAATINVTGSCTLSKAIEAANADSTAGGACDQGSGADTLVLTAGSTHTLTAADPDTTYGRTGLPVVTSVITIAGKGSTIERDGSAPEFRLLAVAPGGDLTLQNLTLQGGHAYFDGVNFPNASGGAVRNEGVLTLTNSTITGNTAAGGGGVLNEGAFTLTNSTLSGNVAYDRGGAVFNRGTVTLTQSTVSGNTASGDAGGGIHIELGSVTVIQSTITGNTAGSRGGGLFNQSTLAVTNSTISGNSASYFGGGVYNYGSGTFTLTNTTISGNSASFYGSGIFNLGALTISTSTLSGNTANCGGGLYTPAGTVSLTNSTVSGNSITYSGGGIDNDGSGTVTLTNSTISGNGADGFGGGVENAGTLTLIHTLVSGNTAGASGPEVDNYYGTVTADAFNLFGHDSDAGTNGFTPTVPTDIVPSEPLGSILDSTLAFNGGPTKTLNLVSGSPAVDAVTSGGCPAIDQRGFVRDVGNCDVGAVEFGASAPPVINSRVTFVPLPDTFSTSTDAAATAAACGPGFVGTFFFQARMTNKSDSPPLAALKASVVMLSNNNLLQTADGGPGGVGAQQTLPQAEDFSDGSLAADGTVDVPFVVCLTNLNSFQLFVNVLGLEE
jgi:hypothetical protein